MCNRKKILNFFNVGKEVTNSSFGFLVILNVDTYSRHITRLNSVFNGYWKLFHLCNVSLDIPGKHGVGLVWRQVCVQHR